MRAAVLVALLAIAAYLNSFGNGFAYDDNGIVTQNPTVTSGDWRSALQSPWWPNAEGGAGLYRPVTSASFAAEWELFGGAPLGFHVGNVAVHALASLLVLALLSGLGAGAGATVGAALFAIHPVHTEAVANVVGRAEIYAACFYLAASLLYAPLSPVPVEQGDRRHAAGRARAARALRGPRIDSGADARLGARPAS
jgi:hypothetical protein